MVKSLIDVQLHCLCQKPENESSMPIRELQVQRDYRQPRKALVMVCPFPSARSGKEFQTSVIG